MEKAGPRAVFGDLSVFGVADFSPIFLGLLTDGDGVSRIVWRPRGGLQPHVRPSDETYPVEAPLYLTISYRPSRRLLPHLWSEITARHGTESLRQLAKEYGVSYEAVRRTLAVIKPQTKLAET